ncbi:MAG TPA: hypothetical protein VM097_01390 [Mycobacteriales bacterium]|nr:hypothetical protein [Mycobacteriales bacterium]
MNRTSIALAVTTVATAVAVSVPTGPARATGCSVAWGSTAKTVTNSTHRTLSAVRAGRHTCYDRLVLDLDRGGEGYRVRYVSAVRDQGRGAVVPLRGGAFLQVDDQSQAYRRIAMPAVAGYTTFRQVAWGGSFEGYTTVGLGVRARLPFRAFRSENHLVIDVAHRW